MVVDDVLSAQREVSKACTPATGTGKGAGLALHRVGEGHGELHSREDLPTRCGPGS